MKIFKRYVEHLDSVLDQIDWGHRLAQHEQQVENSLDGEAAEVLRSLTNPGRIRKVGAFFTSGKLADQSIRPLANVRSLISRPIYDPTCGAGDLFLAWANSLPVKSDLHATVENWGHLINGYDVWDEFLSAAKRRLVLKAISKGARLRAGRTLKIDHLFPNLKKGNALRQTLGQNVQTIVMNPPFNMITAPASCNWSSGKVSLAAVLFDSCLTQAANKTRMVAILPEVLRSGSRYKNWRAKVSERFEVRRITKYGRFDAHADIDVFILEGVVAPRTRKTIEWWRSEGALRERLRDFCDVSVGAVVPHRDPNEGQWAPFVTSKSLIPWSETKIIGTHRRFKGRKVQPPFVAVRRTSSPRDSERAIGAIVLGSEPVAVENHLIVLRPHDNTHQTCLAILKNLRHAQTRSWLNERIRCRHLTVGVVSELPLWEEVE